VIDSRTLFAPCYPDSAPCKELKSTLFDCLSSFS